MGYRFIYKNKKFINKLKAIFALDFFKIYFALAFFKS